MKYSYTVKDIREACEKMLRDAGSYERVDIHESGKELRAVLGRLTAEYEKETYNDAVVEKLKEDTECAALRLESILARVNSYYKERYLTRSKIIERYEQQKQDITRYSLADDTDQMIKLMAELPMLGFLASAVGHLSFSLSEEDVEYMELLGVHGLWTGQN